MSVLRYAQRMREPLVVNDATHDDRFARDPYFADLDCCSLLAVPIASRGTLRAVLVLENRLIRGAFSSERLDTVKLIAGQLAVSLDNAQLYADYRRVGDEQAALRRVATLVARGVAPAEIFDAVTREVGLQCDADLARMERFEPDGTVTVVAAWSRSGADRPAVGVRFALDGTSVAALVAKTGRPARVDSFEGAPEPIARENQALGIRSSVGCPIIVGGRTWGVIAASTRREARFPPDTESGIADFTELVATAVLNAESQDQLDRLASASGHRGRRGPPPHRPGPARWRAAAARPHLDHARPGAARARAGRWSGAGADRRGARARARGQRSTARARPRHPALGPHTRRASRWDRLRSWNGSTSP